MSLDPKTKCRTCMNDSGTYHELYDYVENDKILEMLDGVVPQIHIKMDNGSFSHLVCQACVDKLLTGYKFQQLCIETDKRLHDILTGVQKSDQETTTEPDVIKILDPLTGEEGFKMKQEMEDNENFECEINPDELEVSLKSDEEWEGEDAGGGENADGGGCDEGVTYNSDTDSSNEKLSVLKERKLRKSTRIQGSEKSPKKSRRNSISSFPCPECGKIFDRLYRLKRHGAVHAKKRAFPCDVCKYSFAAEKTYRAHMQIHDKEGIDGSFHEFQCPDCTKSFEKKASLIQHSQIHTKKKDKTKSKVEKSKDGELDEQTEQLEIKEKPDESMSLSDKLLEFNNDEERCRENEKNVAIEAPLNNVVVKQEIVVTPQIFEEPLEDYEDNGEWFEHEDEYDDDSENETSEKDTPTKRKHGQNLDFVDTGIGEIEKPNSRNRRNGNYPCDVCGKIFDRPYRLKRHSSVHSIERPHACDVCKYRFATSNLLKIHMIQHENEAGGNFSSQSRPDGFKCPDCPRRFEKQASLSAHRQIHTRNASEANYPCTVCQRNFMSIRSLTEHITNKHPEVEKHKCDQCDKTFVLHAHLLEHLNRHKGNKNLVCLICEKEFGYTNTLKEHMRTHSGESPYLCPQCGKTFRSASNLRQHMERHFGLKKYQCPECPSRFNCRSDLIKHTSTHTNAKPHVCDICGSRFTRAYSLQKHKLLHSGERPFKCDQCSMTFAIIYHLRRHMRTHTGEKPYKCKYCERAYAESGDLTKHLRTHVGENTYMCDQCPTAFKYQSELRQHLSEHYKMAQQLMQQAQKMSDDVQQQEQTQQQLHRQLPEEPLEQQHLHQQHQHHHEQQHHEPHHHDQQHHEPQQHPAINIPITNSNQPPSSINIPITNSNHPPPPLNLVDGC